jgi:hypothetical protein
MAQGAGRFAGWRAVCAITVLSSGFAADRSFADQQIGAAAQVVNSVTGTLATTRQRAVLRAGIDVFQNEIIDTADNSASRVVFQDQTQIAIGPMSQVTLDRFVFDPNPSNSAVAVSVAKGVARFSTGLLPKPDYLIRTPSCAIGVRGTVLTVIVSEARASTVSVQEGQVAVSAQGVTVIVNAGQTTYVAFGQPPTPPAASTAPPGIAVEMDALLQTAPPAYPPGGPPPGGAAPGNYYPPPGGPYGGAPGFGVPGFGGGFGIGGGFGSGGDRGGNSGGGRGR